MWWSKLWNVFKLIPRPSANVTSPMRKPALGNAGIGIIFSFYRKLLFYSTFTSRRRDESKSVGRTSKALTAQYECHLPFVFSKPGTYLKPTLLSGILCRFYRNTYPWRSLALLTHGNIIPPVELWHLVAHPQFFQLRFPCSSRWLCQTLPSLLSLTHSSYLAKRRLAHLSCRL